MSEGGVVPSVSVTYARNGSSTKANALGMRPMQERAYERRGEQYLLIKSPPPCVRMIWYRLPGKAKLTVGPQGADHDQRFE